MDSKLQTRQRDGRSRFHRSVRSFLPRMPRARSSIAHCEELPPSVPDIEIPPAKAEESAVQFENFAREWQGISQQDNFDGFRIEAANQVTKFLQAAHTLFLGTQLRQEQYIYQFGPAFQSENGRTQLVARAGLDGSVNGRMIQKVGTGFEFKASSNSHLSESQRNMHDGSIDYLGTNFAVSTKLAWQGALIFGGAFSKRIFPQLAPQLQLGGDLTLVMAQGGIAIGQLGLRWAEEKNILTAALSQSPNPQSFGASKIHECKLSYVRKVTDRLSLGTEYKYSHPDMESGLQMGYEYTFRQARVQGLVDTEGKISCSVSDFVGFGFSGMIDYFRGDYKFGVMMHVLPPSEQQPPP